jgi:hypothetical protein
METQGLRISSPQHLEALDQITRAMELQVRWRKLAAELSAHKQAAVAEPPRTLPAGKGVAPRDAWFLQQWEARGTDTYHKPAKVHAKWNAMKLPEREAICPDRPERVSRDVVSKGITRARRERDDRPNKPPAKR